MTYKHFSTIFVLIFLLSFVLMISCVYFIESDFVVLVLLIPLLYIIPLNLLIIVKAKSEFKIDLKPGYLKKTIYTLINNGYIKSKFENIETYEKTEAVSDKFIRRFFIIKLDKTEQKDITKLLSYLKKEIKIINLEEEIRVKNYIMFISEECNYGVEKILNFNTKINLTDIGGYFNLCDPKNFIFPFYIVEKDNKMYFKRVFEKSLFSDKNLAYEKIKEDVINYSSINQNQ